MNTLNTFAKKIVFRIIVRIHLLSLSHFDGKYKAHKNQWGIIRTIAEPSSDIVHSII